MAAQDQRQAGVYRWWGAVAFWLIFFGGLTLAGVFWLVSGFAGQTDVSTTIAKLGEALFVAYCVYGVWRASRSAVVADQDALRVRDFWRTRIIAWSDITEVVVAKA